MVNSPRRYNYCKHICIQYPRIQIYKANFERTEQLKSNLIIAGDFKAPLSLMTRTFHPTAAEYVSSSAHGIFNWDRPHVRLQNRS